MKKTMTLFALFVACGVLYGCCNCEREPIVEQNHALIVPPDFGNMPK